MPGIILGHASLATDEIYAFPPLQGVIVWWIFQESTCQDGIRSTEIYWRKYPLKIMQKGVGVDHDVSLTVLQVERKEGGLGRRT